MVFSLPGKAYDLRDMMYHLPELGPFLLHVFTKQRTNGSVVPLHHLPCPGGCGSNSGFHSIKKPILNETNRN